VLIGATHRVVDAAGLATIVDGEHGPLVLAGQRDGGRVVQLAFDPLESDLPLRVGWPILVMNTVGWLTADATSGESNAIRTGEALVRRISDADAEATPILTGPAGEVSVSEGTLRVSGVDRVGTYEVNVGSTEIRFAANLLSEDESRIRPRDALASEGSPEVIEASVAVARRELWRPLLLGALIVLVGEWLLWNLRRVA
jgi:Ca-activated chloride channel family protein